VPAWDFCTLVGAADYRYVHNDNDILIVGRPAVAHTGCGIY